MCSRKMHFAEVDTDVSLVARLLAVQFPHWANLPIEPVHCSGTDNAIYRLGDHMAVRLPRIERAAEQINKEHQWIPRLAPHLPLAVPVPLAKGMPGEGYLWHWCVCRWLAGENATVERIRNLRQAASDLAHFIAALQRISPSGGRPLGRTILAAAPPLALRDADTRAAIAGVDSMFDAAAVTEVWETALNAPVWQGPPVWIHGDLQSGNLLVDRGRLSAVIDFGGLGVGDPACDLMIAWTLLAGESREVFRAALTVNKATWARGRGWALSVALIALPYYLHSSPEIVDSARHAIDEVLADHERTRA